MKNISQKPNLLFDRVVTILEEARSNVVRSVNSNMVLAYWMIGREIVQEVQKGEVRCTPLSKQIFIKLRLFFRPFRTTLRNKLGSTGTDVVK